MKEIQRYFEAEKFESIFFVVIGFLAIFLGLYFWFSIKVPYYKGIAIPIILIALIQITVGCIVYIRSPNDILRVENIIKSEPLKLHKEEIPRMNIVMKNFVIYRYVEIALILIGSILFFLSQPQVFFKGVGFGIIIQSSVMLLLDYFAEIRGHIYLEYLTKLNSII